MFCPESLVSPTSTASRRSPARRCSGRAGEVFVRCADLGYLARANIRSGGSGSGTGSEGRTTATLARDSSSRARTQQPQGARTGAGDLQRSGHQRQVMRVLQPRQFPGPGGMHERAYVAVQPPQAAALMQAAAHKPVAASSASRATAGSRLRPCSAAAPSLALTPELSRGGGHPVQPGTIWPG